MKIITSILYSGLLLFLFTNSSYTQETSEFLVDTSIVFGPSCDFQGNQAIAFDGTNYLVVWEDDNYGNMNIHGTFIDQSGRILNPYGFNITNTSDNHLTPEIAFDGTNYLIVWSEDKNGNLDIVGTRISTDGKILDPEGISISIEPEDQSLPSITFGGAYYFVTWGDSRENQIYGSRINPAGKVLDSLGIIIADSLNWSRLKACITSDGTNYFVSWYKDSSSGHYGSRINQDGEILDTIEIWKHYSPFPAPGPITSLAFDGDNYLFVGCTEWCEVIGRRISRMGAVIDTINISTGELASVSFNNDHYLVSFKGDYYIGDMNIYARRIDKSGLVLDSIDIKLTNLRSGDNTRQATIASDGTNSLVSWQRVPGVEEKSFIEGSRVDKKGTVLDPEGIIISTSPNNQFIPTVTSDGINYFIVWKDTRYKIFDIYGTRVDQYGNNLNPYGVHIRNVYDEESTDPKVTFGGSYYMVVWIGYEPLRMVCRTRIDQNGILIDTSNVTISESESWFRSSIASDGDKYLIATEVVPWNRYDIYGGILDQSGTVLNTFPISIIEQDQHSPRIAFNGSNYLVVWYNGRDFPGWDIYGTLIDTTGLVLQPEGIQICIDEGHQVYPSAASDGSNYLVVWQDNLDPPTNIWGARLDSSGTLVDTLAFPISLAQGDQEYPVVAFNGNEYVVVWQDNRNGVDYDIYGARVNTNGNVIDSFVVTEAIGDQLAPEIAYSSHNQVLVVYSGWTGEYEGKLYDCMRIWGRYLEGISGIEDYSSERVTEYKLEQCYPNPFNPSTTIQYSIKERSLVELVLYDILGREVEVLVKREQESGYYEIQFNAGRLASGIYLYRMQAGSFIETKKMILLK